MSDHHALGESAEVSWRLDATTVDGTLVKPSGPGPFPAVVMIAGSGPTDRDWTSPLLSGSNGSAGLLAEEFTRAGFASLRYDKRVAGPRAKENLPFLAGRLSMQSHLDELAGAVRLLANDPKVRADRLFALGNSEGTLHALNYQVAKAVPPLAGLVLVAPPGRTVGVVARSQLAGQAAGIPNGEALLTLYDEAIARFLAAEPMAPDPLLPAGVQNLLQALESPANVPFSRELWVADAASLLARVDIPVLVVIGKKDLQVDWQADGEPLRRAAEGHANVTFRFPEDANHVLKHEPRPRSALTLADAMTGYNGPDARLDSAAVAEIIDWLNAQA